MTQRKQETTKRCVIYTRKSTEEGLDKEYNTLEAQFDACASYIQSQVGQGWKLLDRHYDDGGFSGGTMNRPALQQLIEDISKGEIDVVVVYKIDRISRSLADFCELTRMFAKNNVSLVSITQQIDTSTSMGRMIVHLLVSFGQFERETTSDRLADKFAAMRKKGMWNGGVIPFAYKRENRKLLIDEKHAEAARAAFERYVETENYLEVARSLDKDFGLRPNGKKWNLEHVRHMMVNPIYAGKIKDPHTGELFEGQHDAIVPMDLWMKVQEIVSGKAKGKQERRNGPVATLKGFLRCGYCGGAMVPSFTRNRHGAEFRYYRCIKHHKHLTENCLLKTLSEAAIEPAVFDIVGRLMTNEVFLQLVAGDKNDLEYLRSLGSAKSELLQRMTSSEKRRILEMFVNYIEVRRDGISLVVKEDGFRKALENNGEMK